MTSRSFRRLLAAATAMVLISGCASTIAGSAVKVGAGDGTTAPAPPGPSGPKAGVAPAEIEVRNDSSSTSDTLAKNTIADLYKYYGDDFQKDFGRAFSPAKQLISYDSKVRGQTVCGRSLYHEVNASYNRAQTPSSGTAAYCCPI